MCEALVDGIELELLSRGQRACNVIAGGGNWRDAHAADRLLSMREPEAGLSWEGANEDEHCDAGETCEAHFIPADGEYVDDVTGLPLEPKLVQAGRLNELRGFDSRGV